MLYFNQLLYNSLFNVLEMSNPQDQISNVQRLLQILPVCNRDSLFVLLQFLGLVAENSEDRKAEDGRKIKIFLDKLKFPKIIFYSDRKL